MNKPEISIIIRTRNEQRWIGGVLEKLYSQTYKDFEIIVVDSGSTDQTLSILSKFPIKVIQIKPEEFSYPYALNLGVRNSRGEYLAILSAHSLPISNLWLEKGIKHLLQKNIMGVYGPLKAMPDGTFWDKFFHSASYLRESFLCFPKKYRIIKHGGLGVLGFTNAIIKRSLWEEHNFNEKYGIGGEDGEWANCWFSKGYYAIKDIGFTVHHSHYLNLSQWRRQFKYWLGLTNPQPFQYLKHRNDNTHKILK